MADRQQWYYAPIGTQLGPVSTDELRRMLSSGQVPASAPVWREGMADWQPAGQVEELKTALPAGGGAIAPTPPLPPTPPRHPAHGYPAPGHATYVPPGHYPPPGQYAQYAPPGHYPVPGYYSAPQAGDDPAVRWLAPVGRSGWAIAAGYLGLLSLFPLFGPVALICSIIAISHLKKNPHLRGMGRAVFGLVMGIIFSLLLCLFLVGAAAASA